MYYNLESKCKKMRKLNKSINEKTRIKKNATREFKITYNFICNLSIDQKIPSKNSNFKILLLILMSPKRKNLGK